MTKYIAKRILLLIPVLLCVMILIFTLMYFVPGDLASIALGTGSTEAQREAYRIQNGLNDPYMVQLLRYLKNIILHFDFGKSYLQGTSVAEDLMACFPYTVIIALGTVVIGFGIGIPLGMAAAVHQDKLVDKVALFISLLGVSMPAFWLAIMLVILFSLKLKWLPPYGVGGIEYYILPCLANTAAGLAGNVRMTRSTMLEVIRADYVVTARAKGLSEKKVLVRHALPNAMIPIVTSIGMTFGAMLGGAVIIENVFTIPGIGSYMVKAINSRDYTAVQGSVIFLALVFGVLMLVVDLVYAFIDPRIKAQYMTGERKKANE